MTKVVSPHIIKISMLLVTLMLVIYPAIATDLKQTNLVSDVSGLAMSTDPNLVNPWGLARSPTSPWWVSDNGMGISTLYNGSGIMQHLMVTIPPSGSAPTGVVFTSGAGFGSVFVFVSEDGRVSSLIPAKDPTNTIVKVDNSKKGAVYKGVTMANRGGKNYLYVANFHDGTVEVFDIDFKEISLGDKFEDDKIPKGFAPFNIVNIDGDLFVTFAKQDADKHDDVAGPKLGYVDKFSPDGNLLMRLENGDWMNSPWGVALAPDHFGNFSNKLLVGNFGSGNIGTFDPKNGKFKGLLEDNEGNITIDGLWALVFGNNANAGPSNALFFTAGIQGESHGLFGMISTGNISGNGGGGGDHGPVSDPTLDNAQKLVLQGKQIFRFDTFGDEVFWGDTLKIHQAIAGDSNGGIGPGVSPNTALAVGLKVDVDALPQSLVDSLTKGMVDLNNSSTTLALIKLNAVVGINGTFDSNGTIQSIGITCAACHSTVDDSFAPGIGHRLDGWANRDLNVGAIVNLSPDLTPIANLLSVTEPTVRTVLNSWGPGKFDAELFLDGKAFNPQQVTDGVVTGTDVPGATLIPNAYGLAGYNQHTWTGAWGSVPYWNAFVGVLEMHGIGTFFDPRLDNAAKFPIAAANGFGHIKINPDNDQITSKLPALQFYQLALASPIPVDGIDFNASAATLGDSLFSGKAQCNNCHVEPLWTEPGWNLHKPSDIGIDSFEADRAPDGVYKTMNLGGIFVRENGKFMKPENKGRFYHDGRFKTLLDVVNHYDKLLTLGLTDEEKSNLVEYLKSLSSP